MNRYLYRLISAITALTLAALACNVPDEWVEIIDPHADPGAAHTVRCDDRQRLERLSE
jgi:hypothetical protein